MEEIIRHAYALRRLLGVDSMWHYFNEEIRKGTIARETAQKYAEQFRQELETKYERR